MFISDMFFPDVFITDVFIADVFITAHVYYRSCLLPIMFITDDN